MADDTLTPKETESERQPTIEDMKAIADAAVQAAQRSAEHSDDAEKAGKAGADAAEQEAQRRQLDLPPELVKQISDASAKATVAQIRREFELSSQQPATASQSEAASESEAPPDEPPARRPTFADRFLGNS